MTTTIRPGTRLGPGMSVRMPVAPNGFTEETASTSAWQIKQDYPDSEDGLYWIQNANINSGNPVLIYADMSTNGGGWTLLVQNNYFTGWNNDSVLLRNSTTPPTIVDYNTSQSDDNNYSILGWADYIKKTASGGQETFDYMMDAGFRGRNGGIWRANQNYSFVATDAPGSTDAAFGTSALGGAGYRKNITELVKFDAGAPGDTATWDYGNESIEGRMPFVGVIGANPGPPGGQALLTTDSEGNWWGTIIARPDNGFNPVPWLSSVSASVNMSTQQPRVVWYWVR